MIKITFGALLVVLTLFYITGEGKSAAVVSTNPVTGMYKSKEIGRIKRMWGKVFKNKVYLRGAELQLNKDSTYTFSNCNTETGTWRQAGDSILLYCQKNGFIHQPEKNLKCDTLPFVFIRQPDGSLYNEEYSTASIPGYKDFALIITKLEKEE